MSLHDRWSNILESVESQGRLRTLALPGGIDFTSNDYLGYGAGNRGPKLNANAESHSGKASRLLGGHHPVWDEVENELARWHGGEAALIMNTGYVANEGLLSAIIEPQDWVASDQFNHASIIDGLRLSKAERHIYRHNELNHLEQGLKTAAKTRRGDRQLFIVTESLFSMSGDFAPLRELAKLAQQFDAELIVDEAHATGCFGPAGAGLIDAAGLRSQVLATVHTGGKALGVPGAYVCGSRRLKQLLVNRCRHLIFTTALPPVFGAWWLCMLPFVRQDEAGRQKLQRNSRQFSEALIANGISATGDSQIIPVILGSETDAIACAQKLQIQGYDIRAVRPPSVPEETSRLRISIHADHVEDIIKSAAEAVVDVIQNSQYSLS